MAEIRAYRPSDLDDLYHICLATGASGADASNLYQDPKLVGHVFAAPYGRLSPETALVVEDDEGVGGYIDPKGPGASLGWDDRMRRYINRPPKAPPEVVEPFPAHLHIDMLPRLQGRGLGKALIDRWLGLIQAMGARGVHLGVGETNARAVRFYQAYGFQRLELPQYPGALWFTTTLDDEPRGPA